ncbi:hypothetical protein LNTAR_15057 [Lentisphaera araneosa HTCC2155]|uniref:site-specific DNA-methyltransferase (adenine-specific) n=1 Tax=Lentisphaera araneosa HTCC2155 TaxID=313628 RepID=A6DRD6_9BACT|nr:hypothetical protein [Lentisphaera araneosa]EDM25746.1 hypothetical protein LNTAR_15057 [Lentisphaera araneosa HTCC2155]
MMKFINNVGDYFSANYFDDDFTKEVVKKTGYSPEDLKNVQKRISALKDKYFRYKQTVLEGRLRTKDKVTESHKFHKDILNALGYDGEKTDYSQLLHVDEKTVLPVRNTLYRDTQPHLMIMEMHSLIKEGDEEPDGLFEQQYHIDESETTQVPPQKYHRSQWSNVFEVPEGVHISPMVINKAVSRLFLLDAHRRPKYILLCAGNIYYLLEQEKWFRGSYLEFDLESLFDEALIKRDYYSLFYTLLAKETLAPQSEIVLMDQLDEESHKKAYEVTKDLKEGVIHAVETIANEAVYYKREQGEDLSDLNADTLKNECLTYVYRLLFLFYAESRQDLDILPADDEIYLHGYSLEMLRDLEQTPLNTASSQNGFFFHESLSQLFSLLSSGYREHDRANKSFKIRHLDSPLFNDSTMEMLPQVKLRNVIWQDIICQLSLSKQQRGKSRGRISYANLGINQLGSVYESLLAFRGFFAETDTIEVHRKRKNNETSRKVADSDGSYLVPRSRIDDFDAKEVYRDEHDEVKIIPQGTFIYRLSGRDRQKSASYYTPEVLTQCTVKYTLKPILERLQKGEIKAEELLELKILEPAMGAAAFHNEVINQLAEAYLQYRQQELKESKRGAWRVEPDKYQEELQKVKAYIALNNVYGVDLNPTAVELGKLSLWLNVIHKDMQTPFFGHRLGTGNAVVGSWLKVYRESEIKEEFPTTGTPAARKKPIKKEWWDTEPKHLSFSGKGIRRREDQIYHFLLPDKGMVPSAGIKLLKAEYKDECTKVTDWKKEFIKPLDADELVKVKKISAKIDALLEKHYEHQQRINGLTSGKLTVFGIDAPELGLENYAEKERLAAQRLEEDAPYLKLKLIMDYWCSLWFWDVRDANNLPRRQQWYEDLMSIINHDNRDDEGKSLLNNYRLKQVTSYTQNYRFFHYQLEFIEVFRERNGFDVAVGNPPWLKVTFEEKGLMSETFPELEIRKTTAPQARKMQQEFLGLGKQKKSYYEEVIEIESSAAFMNGVQNYPLLKGQQTNLYKCILENGFHWISQSGFLGLVHPEGIYDDPKGLPLRKEVYQRLMYHFQFKNSLMLFSEIRDQKLYSINIYKGKCSSVNFCSINNLFHPVSIDLSFVHDGKGECPALKVFDKTTQKYIWDLRGHKDRIVFFNKETLAVISQMLENSNQWETTKLPSLHSSKVLQVAAKISHYPTRLSNAECVIREGWHETNDVDKGLISRNTKNPDYQKYEMIYSGPHIFTSTSFYKTPRAQCTEKGHYDVVDLCCIDKNYLPRTNYIPLTPISKLKEMIVFDKKPWVDFYKLAFRKMLNHTADRTLNGALIPSKSTHVNGVVSIVFKNPNELVESFGISCSILNDFIVKATGSSNLTESKIKFFPFGVPYLYKNELVSRSLLLSCLTTQYTDLVKGLNHEYGPVKWSKNDARLQFREIFSSESFIENALRVPFERRQALLEIDVIVAMAMGLNLNELLTLYKIEFPKFKEYDSDTIYDSKGQIVYTPNNQGLVGVGVDSSSVSELLLLKKGETYEHTIEKSELYLGKKVIYHAPFDKCDRVEDYKTAWTHFEKVFGEADE